MEMGTAQARVKTSKVSNQGTFGGPLDYWFLFLLHAKSQNVRREGVLLLQRRIRGPHSLPTLRPQFHLCGVRLGIGIAFLKESSVCHRWLLCISLSCAPTPLTESVYGLAGRLASLRPLRGLSFFPDLLPVFLAGDLRFELSSIFRFSVQKEPPGGNDGRKKSSSVRSAVALLLGAALCCSLSLSASD
jgi:hypothetical protein